MNSITKSRTLNVLVLFVAAVATVTISGESCSNQWDTVSAGEFHSLGLMKNGSLLAWGLNYHGQIGTGDTNKDKVYYEPVSIKDGAKWLQIVTKYDNSFGILSDGTLWGWGENKYGQLGDGTIVNKNHPVQIGTDKDWIMVSPGEEHTLALKKDNSLWVFGSGEDGQLGNGAKGRENTFLKPTRILADHKWVKVFAGASNSFAIRKDGSLWAWGSNKRGQLGDNSKTNRLVPVQIAPEIKWKEISAGEMHTLGLDVEGKLHAWGRNKNGALGDGTEVDKLVPTKIGKGTWKMISAGFHHSVGIMENGALFAWGFNNNGRLGDGTELFYQNSPVQIGKGYVWKFVSAGELHTIALTSEGYMMAWGENGKGQTGNGDKSDKLVLTPSICSGTEGFCFQGQCQSSCPKDSFEISKICYKCELGTHFDAKAKTCVPKTGVFRLLRQFILKKLQ